MTPIRGEPGAGPVTGDSGRAVWLEQACSYLRGADPVLARLIGARPDFDPRVWLARPPPMDLLGALLFQVIGQRAVGCSDPPYPCPHRGPL